MSDDAKANSDKITQTVMLRSELLKLIQDAKSSSDKAAQIMLDQIDALRSDQLKFPKEAKETSLRLDAKSEIDTGCVKTQKTEARREQYFLVFVF